MQRREEEEDKGVSVSCELVGMRYGKMSHAWRIEFDIFEIDSDKAKQLMDMIEKPVFLGIVEQE
ncbi:MAG: hypothetical protein CMJ25_17850 [Phycisphaerae bacterium]|nr:hypothetical protein [Phycisphaerae bacterium]|tara:strand:- start:302 stop:493 length:192 start_codon:yes stop_codon:yes gene_type:complete